MNTYLFYDLETTGLSKSFDQFLQFAAVRTDLDFNEIDQTSFFVQLRKDVIPTPEAMLTHRIALSDLKQGMTEFDATAKIHQMINQPGTISLGYNTIGFDDEFLRFAFYRNLFDPYKHQYANGCSRMDLLPIAAMYRLFRKNIIKWPQINGRPTLKLEYLSQANNLASGQAHDAIVDVKATIELAKKFAKDNKMWDYLKGYFNKKIDRQRCLDLPVFFKSEAGEHRLGLMVSFLYGPDLNYMVPVISIGSSISYKNQSLWLRLDQADLQSVNSDNIAEKTRVERKRLGEPGLLLPPSERFWEKLDKNRTSIVWENKKWIESNTQLFQQIIKYHREFKYPLIPDLDIEASLYQDSFFSNQEKKLCKDFHNSILEKKIKLIDSLSDCRIKKIGSRLLCRNYPKHLLTKNILDEFDKLLNKIIKSDQKNVMLDNKGDKRIIIDDIIERIEKIKNDKKLMKNKIDDHQFRLLDELEQYIKTLK